MSDNTNTAESGAGAIAPAIPKSDAEAALQTQATPEASAEPTAEQKAEEAAAKQREEEEGRKKNRTKEYINRINAERAELQRRVAELESRQSPPQQRTQTQQADTGPTLEQYGYDLNAFQQARDAWVLEQAEKRFTTNAQQRAAQAREQETWQSYESRMAEFAEETPDFYEVVGSIDPQFLPMSLQAAIAKHPNGPAIAYHLGTNDEALWNLASIREDLLPAAVQRLAARLGAAPAAPQPTAAPVAPAPTKPLTKAPPPPPMVGGRSPTETPPEKQTDDQWYAKDRERRRKR
jgi:hypothetical protein